MQQLCQMGLKRFQIEVMIDICRARKITKKLKTRRMPASRRKWPNPAWPGTPEVRNLIWESGEFQSAQAPACQEPSTRSSPLHVRANQKRHRLRLSCRITG